MWRYLAKQASSKNIRLSSNSLKFNVDSNIAEKIRPQEAFTDPKYYTPLLGFPRIGGLCNQKVELDRHNYIDSSNRYGVSFSRNDMRRRYGGFAEALDSTDEGYSGSEEIQDLIEEMNKEDKMGSQQLKEPKKLMAGMGVWRYYALKKRQIKMETEAWEEAAKEYQELLTDMCEQKLAPNLPYVKSLFLGWFEPLRDAIVTEQELCKEKNARISHAPYFDKLPADMMAVITMHKLMGLLMTTTGGSGTIRVVQAACQIGEAIEHEARIHWFLEKTKKKKNTTDKHPEGEPDISTDDQEKQTKQQDKLRRKVTTLMKKQKVHQVGCRLIQLLTETAYIQPPADQIGDGPPDIHPAFVHTLKTVTKEAPNGSSISRRYGVIECNPLVSKGLERTARHMIIPYMPMLVPPLNWTGYDRGAYFFLPSYFMRTHGAKQQRQAVKRSPKKQLEPIFEALDTLGNTKWRVNKRVLGVIDRMWAGGGGLAGLVDREDVG